VLFFNFFYFIVLYFLLHLKINLDNKKLYFFLETIELKADMSSKNLDLNTKLSEYTQKMNEALAEKDDHIRQIKKLVNVSIFGRINFNFKF